MSLWDLCSDGPTSSSEGGDHVQKQSMIAPAAATAPAAAAAAAAIQSSQAKLRKRINWITSHLPLAQLLSYERLIPHMLRIHRYQAMAVLRRFEEEVNVISDPNGWVTYTAERILNGGTLDAAGGLLHQE